MVRGQLAEEAEAQAGVEGTKGTERVVGSEEQMGFKAETRQLLDIVTHSLYSDKEVFVRELVSNASDALEKARHASLVQGSNVAADTLEVRISVDPVGKLFAIQDTGIGMTRAEMAENLGTIAKSGSKAFVNEMSGKAAADSPAAASEVRITLSPLSIPNMGFRAVRRGPGTSDPSRPDTCPHDRRCPPSSASLVSGSMPPSWWPSALQYTRGSVERRRGTAGEAQEMGPFRSQRPRVSSLAPKWCWNFEMTAKTSLMSPKYVARKEIYPMLPNLRPCPLLLKQALAGAGR